MGNLCCCLNVYEPQGSTDGSANACFLRKLYNHFAAIFRQRQAQIASSDQGTATAGAPTNEALETRQSNNRSSSASDEHLPCNTAYSQQASLITRQRQAADNSNKLKQLGGADSNMDQLVPQGRRSNGCHSDSSMDKRNNAFLQSFDSLETEDVCPTCLEEYTPENPKITTECCHGYHLSCIYEWLERKNTCPCCSRVMKFAEQT
ncbi:hypothetical protein FNV43_RR26350 [Rhamnella rubrinervis]|uniref:RING-type E3 ubiquitin transferase n=1 Tax=Rhamnella rubrinervis TaxID=2594499 RepID=A0A8K0GME8_9ROSA|nr:hypothetical protein FNV43_RR26350 [Rhamnella rubrinervis]